MSLRSPPHSTSYFVAASVALIALATLPPLPGALPVSATWCLFCGQYGGTDFVLNVGLFVPLGLALGLTRTRATRAVAAMMALTVLVESLQFRFLAGRDASLGDVVANSLGGTLGFAVTRFGNALFRPRRRTALLLSAAYATLLLIVTAGTAWLWQPSVPHLMYGSQWQPRHREFFPFSGRLLDLSLNGYKLEPATMIELRRHVPPLVDGIENVEAVLRAGPPPPSLAPIARLGQLSAEAFLLGRDDDRILFRTRLRAADGRLRVPILALDHAFASIGSDDTVRATAGLREGSLYTRLESARHIRSREMPLTPGLSWSLLLPFNAGLGWWSTTLSALWLGALFVPLGFWSALAGDSRRFGAIPLVMLGFATVVMLGLVGAPRWLGGHSSSGAELAGAAAGLICGVLIALRVDHKHS